MGLRCSAQVICAVFGTVRAETAPDVENLGASSNVVEDRPNGRSRLVFSDTQLRARREAFIWPGAADPADRDLHPCRLARLMVAASMATG